MDNNNSGQIGNSRSDDIGRFFQSVGSEMVLLEHGTRLARNLLSESRELMGKALSHFQKLEASLVELNTRATILMIKIDRFGQVSPQPNHGSPEFKPSWLANIDRRDENESPVKEGEFPYFCN